MHRRTKVMSKIVAVMAAAGLLLTGCTDAPANNGSQGDVENCPLTIYAAVSSEKVNLFQDLADRFSQSSLAEALPGECVSVTPMDVASGEAARLLALKDTWSATETDQPKPTIWSPASSSWVDQVTEQTRVPDLVPDPQSFARTPVVIAMPQRMAETLGWPDKPISLQDLHDFSLDPEGWGKFGGVNALWGNFQWAKTNPNTSTTGQNILLMQTYAAVGKTADLTVDDVATSVTFSQELEASVIHYGNTTGAVLQRLYERDQQGQGLNYISAIALEETSVINYNIGNPKSNTIKPDQVLVPPQEKLVAIYPTEGSLWSNNPVVVLGKAATWVTDEQRAAGEAFRKFVQTPEAQAILGDYGFRPVDPTATPTGLVTSQYGVNPELPAVTLEQPSVEVTSAAKMQWLNDIRKNSVVMELIDISGSMGDTHIDPNDSSSPTLMQAAIDSAQSTIDHFRSSDELGIWAFSNVTDSSNNTSLNLVTVRDVKPLGGDIDNLQSENGPISALGATNGTPLYDAVLAAYREMKANALPGRINAIILLSDGKEDGSSLTSLDALIRELRGSTEGNDPAPVRIFPIVYGPALADDPAATDALQKIAEATGGQVFDASNARRINLTFAQAVNSF